MSDSTNTVMAVTMPQVNVNDEEVTLLGWHVQDGGRIEKDQPLCEIETSKSTGDVPSPGSGIVHAVVEAGQVVAVGQVIGYIGPSKAAIEQHLASHAPARAAIPAATSSIAGLRDATAGAVELARAHGLDLAVIPAQGRIRRSDVERFIAEHPQPFKPATKTPATDGSLPAALRSIVRDEGDLADHRWSIAQHLSATQHRLATAHVVMDVAMDRGVAWMDAQRQAGRMAGPIPLLLRAAAAAATACPALISFRMGRRVYRYLSLDIAFTARTPDGRLFTPVVRNAADRSIEELAAECARLSMGVFRGQLGPEEMAGGALTVSVLSEHPVRFHVGLQNAWQSALITAGAIRDEILLIDGKLSARPTITLTLSYDHGLMDGYEAATALAAAKSALERFVAASAEGGMG